MSIVATLQPAGKAELAIYMPYYPKSKHNGLPYAIALYKQGSIEGQRKIEGGEAIPFVASWYVSKLPSELTRCRFLFDGQADLSYEVTLANSEFIDYLIEAIGNSEKNKEFDFPNSFYRKLLRFDEQ
jgi:hypothetical protein